MTVKPDIIKYFFVFIFLSTSSLFAGTFQINPSNLNDYSLTTGLVYSTSGNISIDTTGATCGTAGFCSTSPPATLTFGTFNLRYGQEWTSITVNITPNAGSVDIYILSETLVTLSTTLAATTSTTISLNDIALLTNGKPFYLKLVFNVNAVVTSIEAVYSGKTVICFPAPYQISLGDMRILYEIETESLAALEIHDNRGQHVRTILGSYYTGTVITRSSNSTTWDGKDEAGRTVSTGLYTVILKVVPFDTSTGSSAYTATFKVLVIR